MTVALGAGQTRDVTLHFDVARDAPDMRGASLDAGTIHHDVPLAANVYSPIKSFSSNWPARRPRS